MTTLRKAWDIIQADLFRHSGRSDWRAFCTSVPTPGFRHMVFVRLARLYPRKHPLGLMTRLLLKNSSKRHGFQIPIATQIGHGLYLAHFGTVIINASARIGSNCNIYPNVTIGQSGIHTPRRVPTIGNNVWIGPGAVLVGAISIGDNVLIAPNAYVSTDVPDNSLVVGNPATVYQKSPSIVDGYINNRIPE